MITEKQFEVRAKALYKSLQTQVRARYWMSGKRKGQLREAATPLPFTYNVFEWWLFRRVGLQAAPCLHCSTPIDILSLTLDHKTPRARGGSVGLENLQETCKACNLRKGDWTHEEYSTLLTLLEHSYLRGELLKRLDAAANGSRQRFFRNSEARKRKAAEVEAEVF